MSNMNSFFDELVEAKKAMEALPTVIVERDRAKGELEVTLRRLDDAYNGQRNLESDLDILRRELAAKEAELAQATFREGEVRSQLEMLVGTFKSVVGDASAAIDLVTPKPEPDPIDNRYDAGPLADPVGQEHNGGGSEPYAPFASTTTGTTETADMSVTDIPNWRKPEVSEAPTSFASAVASEANGSSTTQNASPSGSNGSEVTQSNSGPTVSSTDAQSPIATPNANAMDNGGSAQSSAPASQPEPEPYWKKPDGITWRQWQNQGNKLPWWSHCDDFALDSTY